MNSFNFPLISAGMARSGLLRIRNVAGVGRAASYSFQKADYILSPFHSLPLRTTSGHSYRIRRQGIATATASSLRDIDNSSTSPLPNTHTTTSIPPPPASLEPSPITPKDTTTRWEAIKSAKPFSEFLTDNYQRQHTYLRISITERCNLRCTYCMPAEGITLSPDSSLLTTPEILHIANLFVSQGVTKIRLTGGEPSIRKDIVELITELGKLKSKGLKELAITSNGLVLGRKLEKMVEGGLTAVNLSLDTMDPWKFQFMTRRKGMEKVLETVEKGLELGIDPLKINCVVMKGVNDMEIPDFVALTKDKPIEVRFIEYMPFDGNKWNQNKMVPYADMLAQIRAVYPTITRVPDPQKNDTSKTYYIPGHKGKVGFITSMTHNFCGSCNRLRITSDGNLKVCLFGEEEVSLRDLMRKSSVRKEIVEGKAPQGQVEGGEWAEEKGKMEAELLRVIGVAVKGKKEKHAGMGELENMKNRPMILIDDYTPRQTSLYTRYIPLRWPNIPPISPTAFPIPWHLRTPSFHHLRQYTSSSHPQNSTPAPAISTSTSTSTPTSPSPTPTPTPITPRLTHLTATGAAHMVSIHHKPPTHRTAIATSTITFSNPNTYPLMHSGQSKKGDILACARIAGIMAAKRTWELIPLCHIVEVSSVEVDLHLLLPPPAQSDSATQPVANPPPPHPHPHGGIKIITKVTTNGKTGVEMEALVAATVAGLTVYDMCKSVDRGMRIGGVRVVEKRGGRSGDWVVEEGEEGGEGGELKRVEGE